MSEDKVLFDPGFGPNVADFCSNVDACINSLASSVTFQQKKFKYSKMRHNIFLLIQNNVAFYFGCLLWAYYLKKTYENSAKEISGNTFYGLSEEKLQDYDFFYTIDYTINYFTQYEKDSKYYGIKEDVLPAHWIKILVMYREFLELNNNFVNTKYTNEIILPETFLVLDFDFDINHEIQNAVKSKCIENLLETNIFA